MQMQNLRLCMTSDTGVSWQVNVAVNALQSCTRSVYTLYLHCTHRPLQPILLEHTHKQCYTTVLAEDCGDVTLHLRRMTVPT